MTDEQEVIAGLTPEQLVERAKAQLLELDYWRHILDDCQAVSGAVRDGVLAILDSTTSALELLPMLDASTLSLAESAIAGNRKAIDALKVVSDRLDGMLAIAEGRAKAVAPIGEALLRAAGVEPGDAADHGAS